MSNAQEHVWAFDLGKGSIGEVVREGNTFPHKESLLIPAELARRGPAAVSGSPANKYRAMKTREAHHERERWLATVWRAVPFVPLRGREVHTNPKTGKWELKQASDYQLEREFAPKQFKKDRSGKIVAASYPGGKAKDGAPAATKGDFEICYTSSLLRIRLLRGDSSLAEWQIYKALRSALQKRGYGPVPWAAKEALKQGKTAKELRDEEEKKLQQADERYRLAGGKWPEFKRCVQEAFHFPCYYDAQKMGLWNPAEPDKLLPRSNHLAESTRNIRFDRADVRAELLKLGDAAAAILPTLHDAFARWKKDGWKFRHPVTGKELSYPVSAKTFGEFLCDGPAGKPDESSFEAFLNQRKKAGVQRGSFEEWMAALGQKTPSFDNRILNDCVLIPRFHVCKVDVRLASDEQGKPTGEVISESLLATEVTLLLKLKNLLVSDPINGQQKLTVEEVRDIFYHAHRRLNSLALIEPDGELTKQWPKKVADRFAINKSEWKNIALESEFLRRLAHLPIAEGGKNRPPTAGEAASLLQAAGNSKKDADQRLPEHLRPLFKAAKAEWKKAKSAADDNVLRPMPGHEEVKAPKASGRSAYSRVALRILKELILSGEAPSVFHARLCGRDAKLLRCLGSSPEKPLALFDDSTAPDDQKRQQADDKNRKRGLLVSDLRFLLQMRKEKESDDWKNIFVPSQTLDALQQRHTEDGKLDADAAIRDLLGTINDPIVRHRLEVFSGRLKKLQHGDAKEQIPAFGMPGAVVLEFVREDFMGEEAKREYQKFINDREKERKAAREEAGKLGFESRSSGLRYELWKAQGCICLYTGKPLAGTDLDQYEIDHIVPRSLGGPNAAVNYVLMFHHINHTKEKGKLTPFELLNGKEGWQAYVERVNARATTLRNKKVQLLTRQDAPELVQRYTALAETAWVSKLAQTIVNLRFGWTNGYDEKREKRVIVVSGGLTARVRRKYSLDKLLYSDVTDVEVLAKKVKNREDKRHHALDAMVLTFIPQWARDPDKEGFFKLPEGVNKDFFRSHIEQVRPRNMVIEKALFEDKIYGQRTLGGHEFIVGRESLAGFAIKVVQNRETLRKRVDIETHRIIDATIRRDVEAFWEKNPTATLQAWKQWCEQYRRGANGPSVQKVLATKSKPDAVEEYKNVAKDLEGAARGQFKRGAKHRGYFIYDRPAPTRKESNKMQVEVRPVFVFESQQTVFAELQLHPDWKVHGFFESGCQVQTTQEWEFQGKKYAADQFILGSVWANRNAKLWHTKWGEIGPVGLRILLDAGFTRI